MGMLKEGVRLDRVRGGRQKYRRNPVAHPYQLMIPQTTSQIAPTSLDDIKMLENLSICEPELTSVGDGCIDLMNKTSDSSSSNSNSNSNNSNNINNNSVDDGDNVNNGTINSEHQQKVEALAQEMLSVLGDIYDKELVGVIGWAKQIPGWLI